MRLPFLTSSSRSERPQPLVLTDPEPGGRGGLHGPRASATYREFAGDDPELAQFLRGEATTSSGAVVTADAAMRVATVYRCVAIVAGAIATLPCHVMRDVDGVKRKEKTHALYRLMKKRPNRWQTSSEWRKMMQAHALLRGNAYSVKVRSGSRVVALLPLHPDRVTVHQGPDLSLLYEYQRKNGTKVVYTADEIFHLRDLTTDGVVGMSRIALAREALGLALTTEKFGAAVFKNGAYPGAVIKMPNQLSPEAFARLKAQVEEHRAGPHNAGKTMIFEDGAEWSALEFSAEDAQFLETRKFQRGEIATFFGVPPHLIGDTEKSTSWGSGIAEQNFGFLTFTLLEWIRAWEDAFDRDLLTEAESVADELYLHLNAKGWLRATPEKQAQYYQAALGNGGTPAWMTVDEVRGFEDLNPMGGAAALLQPTANAVRPAGEPRDESAQSA